MQLGFVSAILADLDLEQVLATAAAEGFQTVELMCWPKGKAERRYAGVTHIDVDKLGSKEAKRIRALVDKNNLSISGLGYYPNPLSADDSEARACIDHLKKVIAAAPSLGVKQVNTFVGRNSSANLDDNWKLFEQRWPGIIQQAERSGVRIGIENCPMLFTNDEWPGGKNMAVSPRIWREMFRRIPSPNFGLNYDPSHLVWQFMDPVRPIREFAERIFHVHAKDARIKADQLNENGILATPLEFHQPKLPGLGDVNWSAFFAALNDIRYEGPVCIEVEDRAFEGSLEARKRALRQSKRFLENYLS